MWFASQVRAALGQTNDLLIWFGLAIGAYAMVAILLGPIFLRSAVHSAGQAAALGALHRPRADKPFRPGISRALWRKELQLLGRDTGAMSQLFLQMAYTMPISFIIWASANEDSPMAMSLSPTIVMIACHLSAALTWLALSSEDAPQLMASAPVSPARPCSMFGIHCRGRRADLMRRHAPSKLVALMEHLFAMFLAIGVVACVMDKMIWLAAVTAAALLLWLNYRRARKRWAQA